jgi:hypothetical protein
LTVAPEFANCLTHRVIVATGFVTSLAGHGEDSAATGLQEFRFEKFGFIGSVSLQGHKSVKPKARKHSKTIEHVSSFLT